MNTPQGTSKELDAEKALQAAFQQFCRENYSPGLEPSAAIWYWRIWKGGADAARSTHEPPADDREAFEQWFITGIGGHLDRETDGENYSNLTTSRMWSAWKASRSTAQPPPVGREPPHCPTCSCDVCVCPHADAIDEKCPVHRSRPTKGGEHG